MERNHNVGDMMAHFEALHRQLEALQMAAINNRCELCYRNHPMSRCDKDNMVRSNFKLMILIMLEEQQTEQPMCSYL